jgi:hypothetical protein
VFEEERAKSPYHFSRGGQPKPPIGAPFIHGDRAWGALERMYSDTHWFDRDSVLRLLPKPPPASSFWRDLGVSLSSIVLGDVATASMEERPALLPETYEAILEQYRAWIDLENDTPHGGLSRQRLIEVAKRPDVQEAIAFAKAIRAGSQRAQDEARALIGRVSVPTPDAVDVRRLGLLMKALEHDRAPRRKGTFPRTEAA